MHQHEIYGSSREVFFSDIFHYGKNTKCRSGHDTKIVSGWARVFYGYSYKSEPSKDLFRYSGHCQYVCVENLETRRKFCQVISLSYSELVDDTLVPYYGTVKYEILDGNLFNLLAKRSKKITEQPKSGLSVKEALEIINKGKFYNPAHNHYNMNTSVTCDVCGKESIETCYGYENLDICEDCAEYARKA